MSDHGEWITDWEDADELCDCGGLVRYRLFRRNDGSEVWLHKCQECQDSEWVEG